MNPLGQHPAALERAPIRMGAALPTSAGGRRSPTTRTRTVLFVANSANIAAMRAVLESLEGEPWEVLHASVGADVAAIIDRMAPDVALVDLDLPDSDASLRVIMERAPSCSIVVERRSGERRSTIDLVRRLASD